MAQEVTNYARFYALLKKLPGADKETLVWQFTGGRTTHLRLMTAAEYGSMCREMERVSGYDERRQAWRMEMKRKRSAALHQMQLLGVDTADWARVDAFCTNPRIAGKAFRELDGEELDALLVKLRVIRRKGGGRNDPFVRHADDGGPGGVTTLLFAMRGGNGEERSGRN